MPSQYANTPIEINRQLTTKSHTLEEKKVLPWHAHLEELRYRVASTLVVLILTSIIAFFFTTPLINFLKALTPANTTFVQLTPGEVFFAAFRLSIFCGLGATLPLGIFHLVRFVSPGLKPKENRLLIPFTFLGLTLFVIGVVTCYWAILPTMLTFLLDYGQQVALNQISIASFLNLCVGFLFACGLVFQLPLLILACSLLGLLTSKKLASWWRYAIVASFITGAIVTPSIDPFSQTLMSFVLFGLYSISLVLVKLFEKKPNTKTN